MRRVTPQRSATWPAASPARSVAKARTSYVNGSDWHRGITSRCRPAQTAAQRILAVVTTVRSCACKLSQADRATGSGTIARVWTTRSMQGFSNGGGAHESTCCNWCHPVVRDVRRAGCVGLHHGGKVRRMIALYIIGALLWSYVLLAVLRRLAERRAAQRAYAARCGEGERMRQAAEAERVELWHKAQHVMLIAKLERIAQ